MIKKSILVGATAAVLLTGCKGSSPGEIVGRNLFVDISALSSFFPHDFSATQAATLALRTLDPRYTIQNTVWWFPSNPSKRYRSNPLRNANIDYAHAAGLTGAGQTIAILDEGFLTSHVEFNGKSITTPAGGISTPSPNHGTSVASIAAGSATGGSGGPNDMIGVAPGANLQLGTYQSLAAMTAATVQARSVGAIVQNNSWGYDIDYSKAAFRGVFGGASGQAYLNALSNLSQDAVIVFAASNERNRDKADLMSALPSAMPDLERTWITAINAIPTFRGNRITGAQLLSSRCMEAAAWCMAADGTWTAATGTGNTDYALATGTSMSAPMISGSVALLAEAFPTLSAEELRARLLASANNKFYKHTGYIAFAKGLRHGYNETFGHGFLDMRAALRPIGGSFIPVGRNKRLRVDRPILSTGGMTGDILTRRLADYDISVTDGLGAGFDLPASILTADAVRASGQDTALELLTGLADGAMFNSFPSYLSGRQMDVEFGDTRLALLMPSEGSADNFGFSVMQRLGADVPGLSVGLTAMREGESFIGMQSLISDTTIGGTHVAAILGLELPFSDRHGLQLTGTVGVAMPEGDMPAMDMSSANFNAIGMTYGANDVWSSGDRMTLGVNLPQVVHAGVAKVALPSTRSSGGTQIETFDLSLAPEDRQIDLSLSYAMPVSRRSEVTFSAVHSLNEGHVAGRSASGAGIGFRMQF